MSISPQQCGAEALLQGCVVGLSQRFLGKNHTSCVPELLPDGEKGLLLSQMATSMLKISRCVNLLNYSTTCHWSFSLSFQKNRDTCAELLFQILEQTCLFKHFQVSALLFLLSPWICGGLMCETCTNTARVPVILNFALVLTSQKLF